MALDLDTREGYRLWYDAIVLRCQREDDPLSPREEWLTNDVAAKTKLYSDHSRMVSRVGSKTDKWRRACKQAIDKLFDGIEHACAHTIAYVVMMRFRWYLHTRPQKPNHSQIPE